MKDTNKEYRQDYDYSNYDENDDIVDRGDVTWQEDAGFGDLEVLEILSPEEEAQLLVAIQAEADYHNEYYLGNNEWGPRQITMNNQEYLKLNKQDVEERI